MESSVHLQGGLKRKSQEAALDAGRPRLADRIERLWGRISLAVDLLDIEILDEQLFNFYFIYMNFHSKNLSTKLQKIKLILDKLNHTSFQNKITTNRKLIAINCFRVYCFAGVILQ